LFFYPVGVYNAGFTTDFPARYVFRKNSFLLDKKAVLQMLESREDYSKHEKVMKNYRGVEL
jgi:hypothetical protein